jgi:hypothetical protein
MQIGPADTRFDAFRLGARHQRGNRRRRRHVRLAAGRRADQRQTRHQRRMAIDEFLRDGSAHRPANDVRLAELQRPDQARRIVGHVRNRVLRRTE